MWDFKDSKSTICESEKQALEKILRKNKPLIKSSSMLGVCSVTDDWRERHNRKPKVVTESKHSQISGVK